MLERLRHNWREPEYVWRLDPSTIPPEELPEMVLKAAKMKAERAEKLPRKVNTSRLQAALVAEIHHFHGEPLNEIVRRVLKRNFGSNNPPLDVVNYGACVCVWQLFRQLMIGSAVRKLKENRGTITNCEMEDLRKLYAVTFNVDVDELRQTAAMLLGFRKDTDMTEEQAWALDQNYRNAFNDLGLEYSPDAPEQDFALAGIALATVLLLGKRRAAHDELKPCGAGDQTHQSGR
jgi:hypothetical protein